MRASISIASAVSVLHWLSKQVVERSYVGSQIAGRAHDVGKTSLPSHTLDEYLGEPGRRTRWAKSHPELIRLLEERQLS